MTAPGPVFLQVEPVGQCNLRCRMCPIQFRRDGPPWGPPAFLPFERFTRLVDEAAGIEELHLQGLGEPMMHPRFFDMVRYGAGRGLRVTTNTNMTLMSERRAAECTSCGLDTLHVSLDGATPETYEHIRTGARWNRVVANLETLLHARQRQGGGRPRLHLVMVLMRRNAAELPDIVRLASGWEFEEVFVQHLCHDYSESCLPEEYRPMRDFVDAESLSASGAWAAGAFQQARRAAEQTGIRLRLPSLEPRLHPAGTPGPARCDWPWRGAYVSYDGKAMPCCMVSTPDRISLGDVAKEGFRAVWSGAAYREFRGRLDSDNPPEVCRGCSIYRGTF